MAISQDMSPEQLLQLIEAVESDNDDFMAELDDRKTKDSNSLLDKDLIFVCT